MNVDTRKTLKLYPSTFDKIVDISQMEEKSIVDTVDLIVDNFTFDKLNVDKQEKVHNNLSTLDKLFLYLRFWRLTSISYEKWLEINKLI
jgi:hypothetical protein